MEDTESNASTTSETLKTLLPLGGATGSLLGGLVFLLYCAKINFYPVGVSVGDSLLFVWVALAFGFYYGLWLLVLSGVSIGLVVSVSWFVSRLSIDNLRFRAWRNRYLPERKGERAISISLGAVCTVILLAVARRQDSNYYWVFFAIGLIAFVYASLRGMRPTGRRSTKASGNPTNVRLSRIILVALAIMSPILLGEGLAGTLIERSMTAIGIRSAQVDVLIERSVGVLLREVLEESSADYSLLEECNEKCAFFGVNILFSGPGIISLIEFESEVESVKVQVPSDAIVVVRHTSRGQ